MTGHSVTTREPEYDDHERALIAASWEDEHAPRGRHGLRMSEATDPANQFAFEATGPTEDFAQTAINQAEAEFEKKRPKVDHRSIHFGVKRREA